jgi:antitoxin ParD1/3/4
MAKQVTVNISMPPSLGEFVKRRMAAKGYDNTSEYFRQLVREDQRREEEERLEALLLEGLASGKPIAVTDAWWERKLAKLSGKARHRRSA